MNLSWVLATLSGVVALAVVASRLVRLSMRGRQEVAAHAATRTQRKLEELTYLKYRDVPCPALLSPELVTHLEGRYGCQALTIGSARLPVTLLWENLEQLVEPDGVLGRFDPTRPAHLRMSPVIGEAEYEEARRFIAAVYEAPPSRVDRENPNYRMTSIALGPAPVIDGAFGLYYDNILTQYALEWELKKALLAGLDLSTPGTLPLREATEANTNPLLSGDGRCASITVSTLLVFARRGGAMYALLRRRSSAVGVSRGLYHVAPSGMFEAPTLDEKWSVQMTIWRELLEEVFGDEEQTGTGADESRDYILGRSPVLIIRELIEHSRAELSVTGICVDLLTLRPEICTVLYVPDSALATKERMTINWEYEAGVFATPWKGFGKRLEELANFGDIVVSGAACAELGRRWIERRHGTP